MTGDDGDSETVVGGTRVDSSLACEVTPALGLIWGIWLAGIRDKVSENSPGCCCTKTDDGRGSGCGSRRTTFAVRSELDRDGGCETSIETSRIRSRVII
jgi:hypothetical protein